ncbi:MFS transporter [Actinokineospora bangkokensis]|uniref:MFS transporter n=1 Tax=Actinokineospora bangkokensis TaxID=1193682 RepID=A0A1Q9LNZ6_9PSEU|nr:MFS transporter [Actinokineospora bangkokensis]OLR93735.1 MFS transporter [Actinokineospora bangkokensis]
MSTRTHLLAAGAFTVGSSGYIVSGVLPAVSDELAVSTATAGQLVTVFAIAYAIASPLLATATGRWERRTLLVTALGVSALGNLLAALAPNFALLLVARVVSALGAAVFTPVATGVATTLSPPDHRGRAVATVFGGLTFALIIGVPAGSLLGGPIGYRGVFALVAAVSVLAAVAVRLGLPAVAAPPHIPVRARLAAAADRRAQLVLGMTVLACLAAFGVFTFISPVLAATAGVHGATISVLLLVYGLGGALGNSLSGRLTDRFGSRRLLLVVFSAFTLVLATLPVTATTTVGAGAALFTWGLVTWSVNPPIQNWLIELSPSDSGMLLSVNASAIYLGVGLSGVFGGLVIGTAGILALAPIAACVGALALVLLVLAHRSSAAAEREPVAA